MCIVTRPHFFLTTSHQAEATQAVPSERNLKFDPVTSSYSGLTFTFDPRLDKQVERLHFDHWLSIMQQSSSLLYDSLNGRAHLAEVRVLIPYKWRQFEWPVLHKPGSPIITNRRLRYADSDVIVGHEDPIYKETPFAMQHDECGQPGLNIRMPISFLDQQQQPSPSGAGAGGSSKSISQLDVRLKARQFVREFASHRYGIFKESGFRGDAMYPPFSTVAGFSGQQAQQSLLAGLHQFRHHWPQPTASNRTGSLEQLLAGGGGEPVWHNSTPGAAAAADRHEQDSAGDEWAGASQLLQAHLKGFDEHFQECQFDTSVASGLPANAQAAKCMPYLVRVPQTASTSFNLMSSDPFSYTDLRQQLAAGSGESGVGVSSEQSIGRAAPLPVQWSELADQAHWHFCGENFPSGPAAANNNNNQQEQHNSIGGAGKAAPTVHYEHNQRATNKQNTMCQERSALDVIRASPDFKRAPSSPSTFNRLPAPSFKFLQEMPPRVIMCFEYTSHLFQSRRLDHGILEAAVNKFLAFDLIADSELATIVFGQHQSRALESNFQRLDSSLNSRFALFNPAIDPFDEQVQLYTTQELAQMNIQIAQQQQQPPPAGANLMGQQQPQQQQQSVKLLKGSCSFGRLMAEVNVLLLKSSVQYDDIGADVIVLTSGLFVEDETKIEDILRASSFKREHHRLNMIVYPSTMLFDTKSRDGYIVLDSLDSEQIIKSRISKLLLIRSLTGGQLHLIREQVDANGDVKMSTLMQFYQIFDHLAKGHSWDQTNSMLLLTSQQVDSRQQPQQVISSGSGALTDAGDATGGQSAVLAPPQHNLTFQFELDDSVQNELFVGFIDPRVSHHHSQQAAPGSSHGLFGQQHQPAPIKTGKRFTLKNLQLRSPGGQFVFTETGTFWTPVINRSHTSAAAAAAAQDDPYGQADHVLTASGQLGSSDASSLVQLEPQGGVGGSSSESAFFPYRAQLSLAAFHIKPWHLAQLKALKRLSGTWTLSAISDEPIQTSGLAMARANPQGTTLMASCWIQTYHQQPQQSAASPEVLDDSGDSAHRQQQPPLKQVKVFVQASGADKGSSELVARMEVQDEMGNIVQNVNMLDDGLGSPDMTQNDGILSQFVQRATRPGFYKVSIELTTPVTVASSALTATSTATDSWNSSLRNSKSAGSLPSWTSHWTGQDNACCGSFIPRPPAPTGNANQSQFQWSARPVRHVASRQLYCGTFYVDPQNKLSQQRPPRVTNMTVVNVDQDNRRVTIRWFEPAIDISSGPLSLLGPQSRDENGGSRSGSSQLVSILSDNDLLSDESATQTRDRSPLSSGAFGPQRAPRSSLFSTRGDGQKRRQVGGSDEDDDEANRDEARDNVLVAVHQQQQPGKITSGSSSSLSVLLADQLVDRPPNGVQLLANRYEIKLFTDRDMIKRAFDSKHEVGFRFSEWNVEGQFLNASHYGGMKEVTLRIPFARKGDYFIAMKVHNNQALASPLSNIVQFYLRNNMTLDEVESIYNQPGTTIDAEGNVYDKNGELIHQRSPGAAGANHQLLGSYSLLKGTTALDGLSVLVLFSLLAFIMTILCITLVACLASSARQSIKTKPIGSSGGGGGTSANNKQDKTISSLVMSSGAGSGGCGSGSSMVSQSSGCESSQHSEVGACSASSLTNSSQHQLELQQSQQQQQHYNNHDHLVAIMQSASVGQQQQQQLTSYNKLQQQHKQQQQQAHMIHNQMISSANQTNQQQQQQQDFYNLPTQQYNQAAATIDWQQQQQQQLQHTVINGYTYATVMPNSAQANSRQAQQAQQYQMFAAGDLNQNGLGLGVLEPAGQIVAPTSSVQSWPADVLLSHYDKVKQARERNEPAPVMRIETIDHTNGHFSHDGLPLVMDVADHHHQQQQQQQLSPDQQASARSASQQQQQQPSYLNQQLQQQLSSVLKSKRQQQQQHRAVHQDGYDVDIMKGSSPALEGVTGELNSDNERHQLVVDSSEQLRRRQAFYRHQYNDIVAGALEADETALSMPPPPQYIYCTPATSSAGISGDTNGLATQITDPTIYSQATNLQQVGVSLAGATTLASDNPYAASSSNTSYYANHTTGWQQQQQHDHGSMYGTSAPSAGSALQAGTLQDSSTISEV